MPKSWNSFRPGFFFSLIYSRVPFNSEMIEGKSYHCGLVLCSSELVEVGCRVGGLRAALMLATRYRAYLPSRDGIRLSLIQQKVGRKSPIVFNHTSSCACQIRRRVLVEFVQMSWQRLDSRRRALSLAHNAYALFAICHDCVPPALQDLLTAAAQQAQDLSSPMRRQLVLFPRQPHLFSPKHAPPQ
jgi:hypothetical protein